MVQQGFSLGNKFLSVAQTKPPTANASEQRRSKYPQGSGNPKVGIIPLLWVTLDCGPGQKDLCRA